MRRMRWAMPSAMVIAAMVAVAAAQDPGGRPAFRRLSPAAVVDSGAAGRRRRR